MSVPQRVVAVAVAVLVIAGFAVIAVGATGAPIGLGPGESTSPPSASASPITPTASAVATEAPSGDPSAPDEGEILEILAEIEQQVIAIRGLPAADIGPADIITRAELGAELQAIFDAEYPPGERERDNQALRALGLLGPDEDVAELQLELLGDSVLGFYDDVDRRMVVVSDAGLNTEAKLTYAHEYAHALQDAAFGLDSLETDAVGEDDRSLARTALIEGDATTTMLAWAIEHLTPQELLELGATPIPDTSGIPSWMVKQLEFPYTAGQLWVGSLAGDPLSPDFGPVDAAFADPPDSTEQVIDLDAWESREAPLPVDVLDLASALGDEWAEVDATPVGQAAIEITLTHFGVAPGDARAAAAGWGGDRAVIASGPDGAFAVAWRLAWDAEGDADEFVAAYEQVIEELPFPATVREVSPGEVLVLHGSDEDVLGRVADAAD